MGAVACAYVPISWDLRYLRRSHIYFLFQIPSSQVVPTSVSSARSEHIDYLFYDSRNLFLKEVLLEMPDSPTPNKVEPSDHMPVGAKFQWARQHTQLPPLSAASAGFSSGTVMASMIAAVFAASVFTNLQAKL